MLRRVRRLPPLAPRASPTANLATTPPAQVAAVRENLPRGRVSAQELNVRAGAAPNFEVVARLRFLDTVTIEGPPNNGWLPVSHSAGFGFVNGTYIQRGGDAETLQRLCGDLSPCRPPELHSSARAHRANMNANHVSGRPRCVRKAQDGQGRTVISGYVRRGDTHTFSGIPTGSYTAWFATGEEFSIRCGRFLRDMSVTYDPSPQQYKVTFSGNLSYSTVMTYSLQLQRQGNFSPMAADATSFLLD